MILLKELIDRDSIFSPFYADLKTFEPAEVDFFKNYRLKPNYMSTRVPPAQVQWQWFEKRPKGQVTYGLMFGKDILKDNPGEIDVYSDAPKRYKMVGVAVNDANGITGMLTALNRLSDPFTEPYNLEILEDLLESHQELQENYISEIEKPTFFGAASGFYM